MALIIGLDGLSSHLDDTQSLILVQTQPAPSDGGEAPHDAVPGTAPEGGIIAQVEHAEDDAVHEEGFFEAAETWVAIALIILIVVIARPAGRAIAAMLDKRADRIREDLDEAQKLREEAQSTLASFQRRQRDAIAEAEQIIAHAKDEAERIRTAAMADLESALKRREAQAMDRIAQAEVNAAAEVRAIAVDVAVAATRELLESKVKGATASKLIDKSIKDLSGNLH